MIEGKILAVAATVLLLKDFISTLSDEFRFKVSIIQLWQRMHK